MAYLSCGEGEFPISRYCQMVALRNQIYATAKQVNFLEGLHIEKCHNVDDLLYSLKKRIPADCSKMNLKMLIIDSIAGLVRTEFDTRDIKDILERTRILFTISTALKWLSDTFKISIVVVNQVGHEICHCIYIH